MASARNAFAVSCVSLADVFNPSHIVVGGSLAVGQGERLLGPAREAVASRAFRRVGDALLDKFKILFKHSEFKVRDSEFGFQRQILNYELR